MYIYLIYQEIISQAQQNDEKNSHHRNRTLLFQTEIYSKTSPNPSETFRLLGIKGTEHCSLCALAPQRERKGNYNLSSREMTRLCCLLSLYFREWRKFQLRVPGTASLSNTRFCLTAVQSPRLSSRVESSDVFLQVSLHQSHQARGV